MRLKAGHDIPDIKGQPIHHRVWPKEDYRQHLLNPEMLIVCEPQVLPDIGSGAAAHIQMHEVYGKHDPDDGSAIYREMQWGDIGDPGAIQIMRMQAFKNPNDRVPIWQFGETLEAKQGGSDEANLAEHAVITDTAKTHSGIANAPESSIEVTADKAIFSGISLKPIDLAEKG